MRLINADEALNLIDSETKVETNSNVKAFNDALEVAIQIIDTQKTVKAIPIEWIEKFMNRFRLGMVTSDEYALLHFMLTEWEVENEQTN